MWISDRYGLVRRPAALNAGVPVRVLEAAVRSGELVRVGRGVYVEGGVLGSVVGFRRREFLYRARCMAVATKVDDQGPILSHDSAAALLALPVLRPDLSRVHLTTQRSSGGCGTSRTVVRHTGVVDEDDVVFVHGIAVTSPARTAVDLALAGEFAIGLAAFDSALRAGVEREELEQRLHAPRRGVGAARFALRHANRLADNPGESWCRAQVIEAGLPTPELQVGYALGGGRRAYVDLDFAGKVVVEFDGLHKYGAEFRKPGRRAEDVVVDEKLREDRLRALGLDVVRTVWARLHSGKFIPELTERLASRGLR